MKSLVLVVDDDIVDRIAVRRSLRAGGFEVEVHESDRCADALARLETGAYHAVFLDYLLPDGTGLSVIEGARARGVRSPIIVLTGQGDERTAVELMKAGASDYLPKSQATPERIAQVLRNALRVYQAERQAMMAERERARALVLEQRARDDAETAQRRLAFLAEASALVSSSLDYQETLHNVARLAVPSLAEWCFVDLLEEDGSFLRMAVAHADPEQADLARRFRRRYAGMPDAPHGVSRVIATARPEVMTEAPDWLLLTLARDGDHLEMMRQLRPASIMIVPLIARGRTLGAMTFVAVETGRYQLDDLAFAEEIARRAALAVDNARLFDEVKRGEEALRRQLDFTTAITGSLAEGVCALDAAGRFTFANAAAERILGHEPGGLTGRGLDDILEGGSRSLLGPVLDGSVVRVEDGLFTRSGGAFVPVSFVASPIVTGGRVRGAVLAFHDATQRKRAEAELEASRRQLAMTEKLSALGTLVSGVAHELRTPLTYLTNNIFLLQKRLDVAAKDDPALDALVGDVRHHCAAAMEGVDRINALVRDMRPFSRSEGSRRSAAGVHEVVAGAVDLFRATQRGRVEVVADLQPTEPIALDRGQVQRVVINLLLNAAEAMPQGGSIRVTTRQTPEGALLEVADQGVGIPPHVEARIFDPFFTTKDDGTGLGLAITRRIVEAHGGEITYRTAQGRGTTFTIRLPRHASEPKTEQPEAAVHAAAGQ